MSKTTLRELTEKDHTALVELANNKKIWSNLRDVFPHPYSAQDGHNFISMVHTDTNAKRFAIDYDSNFVGMIGMFPQGDVYRYNAELGYWIGEKYWGKGIGTSAVSLIVEYAFNKTEITRLYAGIFGYNKASAKILEKNNFRNEGIAKSTVFKDGEYHDEMRYAILKEEWIK